MSGIDSVGIIGVGMIGASLVQALRRSGFDKPIYGYDTVKIIDDVARDMSPLDSIDAVCEASHLIVLATPPGQFAECIRSLVPLWSDEKILTDVGSVKRPIIDAVATAFGKASPLFVPGHPIAGTEKSSAKAADAGLFEGATVILTPGKDSDKSATAAIAIVASLWEQVGGTVEYMDSDEHDYVFAAVSHLPHMLAYALVNCLVNEDGEVTHQFTGRSFRDYSRLASSDPTLWRDIGIANKDNLAPILKKYAAEIEHLIEALERGDGDGLRKYFARARQAREGSAQEGK